MFVFGVACTIVIECLTAARIQNALYRRGWNSLENARRQQQGPAQRAARRPRTARACDDLGGVKGRAGSDPICRN